MIQESLKKIIQRQDLDEAEMASVMGEVMSGNATDAQIGALMAALAPRRTFSELAGAARACGARRRAFRPPPKRWWTRANRRGPNEYLQHLHNGGVRGGGLWSDRRQTREPVRFSKSGSADLLEALECGSRCPRSRGTGHRGNRYRLPVRAGLPRSHAACGQSQEGSGIRSIFNMLGPLTNPLGPTASFWESLHPNSRRCSPRHCASRRQAGFRGPRPRRPR